MVNIWLLEIVKGAGKLFLNPLLYWGLLLFFLVSYRRVKGERKQFGAKVFPLFSEGSRTWLVSLFFGLLISVITVVGGIVINVETIILLIVVTISLSLFGSLTLLSASYTFGLTFILLFVLPLMNIPILAQYGLFTSVSIVHLINIAILIAIFLLMESVYIHLKLHRPTYPSLRLSKRGIWIGQHHITGFTIIPFFVLVPSHTVTAIEPFLPYFYYQDQKFSLVLFPFLLGFRYVARHQLPQYVIKRLGKVTFILSVLTLLSAVASIYYTVFAFVTVVIAIIGKEWIMYRHKANERDDYAIFHPLDRGVKVLSIIPDSPADRLEIKLGETILKVNDTLIEDAKQFYEALQNSGAFFKLDVIDENGEVRFIKSAFYEQDHHELGIIFPKEPYRTKS